MNKEAKPKPKSFIRQVSRYSGDRHHIEVPKKMKDDFKPGDSVRVELIE